MNKQQYLDFMKKYASKDIIKKHCQQHNADGTFAHKKGTAGMRTVNLQKYVQDSKRD